nr:DUF411 domain-containing protein [Palleronia sp. THAF1]
MTAWLPVRAMAQTTTVHVMKDPSCGCCADWIEILRAEGFTVEVTNADHATLRQHKIDSGLPAGMTSCHTATVDRYVVEGHVPVADIRTLLVDRPDAIGLTVPGMPYGSPGMGPESQRDAYDVHLILPDGTTEVFNSYAAA